MRRIKTLILANSAGMPMNNPSAVPDTATKQLLMGAREKSPDNRGSTVMIIILTAAEVDLDSLLFVEDNSISQWFTA